MPVPAFVEALERCITELSAIVSHTSTIWADHCESPGDKTQFQAPLAREKRPGPLRKQRSSGCPAQHWLTRLMAPRLGLFLLRAELLTHQACLALTGAADGAGARSAPRRTWVHGGTVVLHLHWRVADGMDRRRLVR